ncbi:hypothetical protein O6H91_13G105700 [Diphasiastrum complanatum]|uniref:Uncharacterized protein n=1 Tax=Diphasiastrum complanatum TaxID=34168 RepID=A0ACC2BYA8_DIPCM|nr:hypothetical protein O6H91_13G105700 [Diphasiastrum complanatum]
MATQQSSRLHRLLTLLDTGSTSTTRRTAARQIGEIAKNHRAELPSLLKRVRQFLRSKNWDTRVAAAQAIGAIAENVSHVTVQDLLASAVAELKMLGDSVNLETFLLESDEAVPQSGSLAFSRFDVQRVLEYGAPLLASGGQEYDIGIDNTKTPAERLARQKQNLRRRLGLDVCEQFMDFSDMIRDEDLMIPRTTGNNDFLLQGFNYHPPGGRQEVQHLVADMFQGSLSRTLSARERNLLKRKAKVVKDGSKEWCEDQEFEEPGAKRANMTKSLITENVNQGGKFIMESVVDEDSPDCDGDGRWPFGYFVDLLIHDMFDTVWEVRHGSIMALREILSSHASSAAVVALGLEPEPPVLNNESGSTEHLPLGKKEIDLNIGCYLEEDSMDVKIENMENGLSHQTYLQENEVKPDCKSEFNWMKLEMPSIIIGPSETQVNVKPEFDLNMEVEDDSTENVYDRKALTENGTQTWSGFTKSVLDNLPKNSRAARVVLAAKQAWGSNLEFLQDCTIRLLCVFSLDRFGDFVSDQVVAPVRETCAQALGAVLKQMHPPLVHETLGILLQMQRRPEWEVRHGSLLGIKYLIAIRQEMISQLLPRVLPACMSGLEDPDDDVRAVAAEALLPAARAIVTHASYHVDTILMLLWDILLDLDDLSPSTSSVMHLLAELYSQSEVVPRTLGLKCSNERPLFDLNEVVQIEDPIDDPFILSNLAPRLWPFMRHNIASVRHAAIRTLERLLEAGSQKLLHDETQTFWAVPILGDALRIVFQNLLMENDESILQCSERVWRLLLECPPSDLATTATAYFPSWLKLASTAAGSPLETSKMFSPTSLPRRSRVKAVAKLKAARCASSLHGETSSLTSKDVTEKHRALELSFSSHSKIVVGADGERAVIQMRVATASALGIFAASMPESTSQILVETLLEHLASISGVQRQVASMVLVAWFRELRCSSAEKRMQAFTAVKHLYARLLELLQATDPALPTPDSSLPYAELTKMYGKMRSEAAALIKHAEGSGLGSKNSMPGLAAIDRMNAESAIDLAMKFCPSPEESVGDSGSEAKQSTFDLIESSRQRLLATAGCLKCVQSNLHVSVLASLAGAVVWMGELPLKLNPIIQPLMAAVKREQDEVLQRSAAEALAEVIGQCVGRKPSPNEKLIKNLSVLTCADHLETPQATEANATWINFDDLELGTSSKFPGAQPKSKTQSTSVDERLRMEGTITRRGAELAFQSLSQKFTGSLFEKLPRLWDCLTEALLPANKDESEDRQERLILELNAEPQTLINNLQLIRSIAPVLDKTLHSYMLALLPAIFGCIRHRHAAVRLTASRCLTAMAKAYTEPVMSAVLAKAVPMLEDTTCVEARQGAGMLVTFLVGGLGADLVAYAPLLIVPLLGCMSDSNQVVRQSVTQSFAALVPLLPLARGMPPPPGLDECQASKSFEDTKFLEQLLDNSRVDDYKLAIELKTTLRRYQQEGINWLAFLKRFKLHGILCDDMGLGKTLQASAIVASDTVERLTARDSEKSSECTPIQSLVVCPSTLVGHWFYEVEKFVPMEVLKPLQYLGSPQDRLNLRDQLSQHNLIITSYDILRKDIDFMSQIFWNYCILDEGHIIKSSKSKITLAAKRIHSEHRLILSGTPIQNNVLELWSLFDFLMPGFLGTERQFQATYGKPLAAARDVKCSPKEAEAGVLAMEALHKQVMPFLLRRTKDEVLADLPPKIIQDRFCDLSPLQLKLYEDFSYSQAKKEVSTFVKAYGGQDTPDTSTSGASTHVFQALQYLRKLCSHPLLVLDELQQDYVSALKLEVTGNGKDMKADLHELQHAPKLLALQEILEECGIGIQTNAGETSIEGGHHRVLVFAQLKGFLDIIEKDLFQAHMKGVTYLRLDGSVETDKRFDIVKAFNSDPTIDVLLLTTHVGGLGLNLTAADTVVFMEHDWNPMRDLQAMDRAHRLGQRRVVNVHRLIMRGTLEEKVMSLQRFKLSIANTVINAENASLNTMDTTQLLDLFTVSGSGKKLGSSGKPAEDSEESNAVSGVGGKGLKAMLNSLEELWDQSQYTEEFNLSQFVTRLKG